MKKELLELLNAEHDTETTCKKKAGLFGYDADAEDWRRIAVDANGKLKIDPTGLVESFTHVDLSDMPDTGGTNTDHDVRYGQYATRSVIVDKNATAITGKVYTTIQAAINYAVTQTPSSASPWLVQIKPGIYAETVTCAQYVDLYGEGYVEIQPAAVGNYSVLLTSNITLTNITSRVLTTSILSAFTALAPAKTNVKMYHCHGIADAGTQTHGEGMYWGVGVNGYFYDCIFEGQATGAWLYTPASGTAEFYNCKFYAYDTADNSDYSRALWVTESTGQLLLYNCNIESAVSGTSTKISYGVYVDAIGGGGSTVKLYNCSIIASGLTGEVDAVYLIPPAEATAGIELHRCTVKATSTSSGDANGLYSLGAGTGTLTMVNGSILTSSSSGTPIDAKRTTGTITLKAVQTDGKYSGTITYDGELVTEDIRISDQITDGTDSLSVANAKDAYDHSQDGTVHLGIDTVKDTHIDWGTGASQVSGADMPIADAGGYFGTDNVENALQDAGAHIGDNSQAHSDYLINNGADSTSGALTSPNFISNVATGTQPFACTSTTKNTNLNADAVDGIDGDDLKVHTFNFIIDGGGSAITTGEKGHIVVDVDCTILSWTLLADAPGSIVIDVWKDTYANFPPTNDDAMPGAGKEPTLSSVQKNQDTDVTDWADYTIDAGDVLAFNIDSATTVKRVVLSLKVQLT